MSTAGRDNTVRPVERMPASSMRADPPLAVCRHRATQLMQNGRRALTAEAESRTPLDEKATWSASESGSAADARAVEPSWRAFAEISRISRETRRSMVPPGGGGPREWGRAATGASRGVRALLRATAIGRSRRFRHRRFSADGEKQPSGRMRMRRQQLIAAMTIEMQRAVRPIVRCVRTIGLKKEAARRKSAALAVEYPCERYAHRVGVAS